MKLKLFISCFLVLIISSCTIQKRHYSSGFYIHFQKLHSVQNKVKLSSNEFELTANNTSTSECIHKSDSSDTFHSTPALPEARETKKQRPFSLRNQAQKASISSTKNEIKSTQKENTPNPDPEITELLKKNKKNLRIAIFSFILSAALFAGSGIIYGSVVFPQLMVLGIVGMLISIFLFLIFTGEKMTIKEKLTIQESRIKFPEKDPNEIELELARKKIHRILPWPPASFLLAIVCLIGAVEVGSDLGFAFLAMGFFASLFVMGIAIIILIIRVVRKNQIIEKLKQKEITQLIEGNNNNSKITEYAIPGEQDLKLDKHHVRVSLATLLLGFISFIGAASVLFQTEAIFAAVLLYLSLAAIIIGGIMLIKYARILREHRRIKIYYQEQQNASSPQEYQAKSTNELATAEQKVRRILKLLYASLGAILLGALLSFIPFLGAALSVFGIYAALTFFFIYLHRVNVRNRLLTKH